MDDDRITPDAFRDQFADGVREVRDITGDELKDELKANVKESVKRGVKQSMNTADKVWVVIVVGGIFLVRDSHQRKQIKELRKLAASIKLENEFLNAFIRGFMDPLADKNVVLADMAAKLHAIKSRAA